MSRFLIVAGSSGIGIATAHLLRQSGHEVVLTTRTAERAASLAVEINAPCHVLDATDFAAVEALVGACVGEANGLDGIVNCAGSLLLRAAHTTSQDQYQAVINASLTTAFACVRAAGKHMKTGGSVVLISSAAASTGLANHEAIAAAKAGINGLIRSAAATYAGQNLRFNGVAPGLTQTPLTAALTSSDVARAASESMHALGRLGQPDDIARAIAFLLSPTNAWITGQILGVDGGLATVRPKMKA